MQCIVSSASEFNSLAFVTMIHPRAEMHPCEKRLFQAGACGINAVGVEALADEVESAKVQLLLQCGEQALQLECAQLRVSLA